MSTPNTPPFHDLVYYTYGTPDGAKPAIYLEELGLPYKCVTIDIMNGAQNEPSFRKINPNGKIPALQDGPIAIFESVAIMLYLAEHYDTEHVFSYPKHDAAYWNMLGWLMFQTSAVSVSHGTLRLLSAMLDG